MLGSAHQAQLDCIRSGLDPHKENQAAKMEVSNRLDTIDRNLADLAAAVVRLASRPGSKAD